MAISRRASKPKQLVSSNPEEQNICFTIMPFGGFFDLYYTEIFVPAIQKAGLIPHRADDLYRPSTITNDIWTYTQRAKLVLADLSGRNPNVFYELGLAHALAKPAIMVTESIEDIPFDLRSLRIISYDKNDPVWGTKLSNAITSSIRETVESPVEAILPTFLTVRPTTTPTVSAGEKVLLDLKREMDLLRNQILMSDISKRTVTEGSPRVSYQIIAEYLRAGYPRREIVGMLERLGLQRWEIEEVVRLLRSKLVGEDAAEVARGGQQTPGVLESQPDACPLSANNASGKSIT